MNTPNQAKQLLKETTRFHTSLIQQARAVGKFKEILEFIVECISFAEKYFPQDTIDSWSEGKIILNELSERAKPIQNASIYNLPTLIPPVYTTGGTLATGTFAMLTDNFRFLEDNESRSEYSNLAGKYGGLLNGPEEQSRVQMFLEPLNATAQIKFNQSLQEMQSLPGDEDPQGPLVAMRSAIDLALRSLLKLTPLTKRERKLKSVDLLPTIAQHLARDELTKVDLVLTNDRLAKLKGQLSASKEIKFSRTQADALMSQAVAILHLIASSINLPDDHKPAGNS